MNVYTKLAAARVRLQKCDLKKSGENKFAGYKYFELGDIMPAINVIFDEIGLCGVVSFAVDMAYLTIYDISNAESHIVITSPMAEAALKGAHAIQNLGAVQTYLRRYLWMTALEISEIDTLDKVPAPSKKATLTNARFSKALEQIKEGKYTTDKLRGDFDLTDEQENLLQDMIENA